MNVACRFMAGEYHAAPREAIGGRVKFTTLSGVSPDISRLGFGCAPLGSRYSKREALRALELAYDSGITYVDVARAYGHGEAEAINRERTAENILQVLPHDVIVPGALTAGDLSRKLPVLRERGAQMLHDTLTRREALFRLGGGLGGLALSTLLAESAAAHDVNAKKPHHASVVGCAPKCHPAAAKSSAVRISTSG